MTLMLGCKSINEANTGKHEQAQEQLVNAFLIHNSRSIYYKCRFIKIPDNTFLKISRK